MDPMQQAEVEMQASIMQMMMQLCSEKTLKKSHASPQLSADEKQQFTNCLLKAFEAPGHILSAAMP